MSPQSAVLPEPAATSKKHGRVLFALSHDEWPLFFPEGVDGLPYEIRKFPQETNGSSFQETLRNFSPDALVTSWSTPPLPPEFFTRNTLTPKYICHTTGSVKHLIPREFMEKGGIVSNWGTLAAQTVAEHALLLTLAALRRMPEWEAVISGKRRWQPSAVVTQTLYGKRLGLHGFGNVAQTLVHLMKPFGVSISAWSEGVPEELYRQHGVRRAAGLEDLMADSEILIECEALTAKTKGTLTGAVLKKLPHGAIFVNVGRGLVVDEAALAHLASQGHLLLALDVFSNDPIASDSPLHQVEGAVFSPHLAGPTNDQFPLCGQRALRNLEAFFSGQRLEATLTLEMYDRST